VGLLGEAFTVLAIVEAVDKASEIYAKIDDSVNKFSTTMERAAEVTDTAGKTIDEGLLKTASGADAVSLATARVEGAQARLASATEAQANAERSLLDAQTQAAAAADGDAVAQDRLAVASETLTKAQADAAKAAAALGDAQKVQADTAAASAAVADGSAAAATTAGKAAEDSGGKWETFAAGAGKASIAMGLVAGVTVKMAGDFQSLTAHLVTDAGESQSNLAMVQQGILGIATATGTSTTDLVNGMYHIESAGMHGASGLATLTIAAQGAKVGGADLDTVSRALVGSMNAYGMTSTNAAKQTQYSTAMMNQLIATVGAGDMRMQDLASAMSSVTASAAAAHIPFAQLGGAIATMTAQGMTANQATQDLNHTIGALSNPNNVQIKEMQAMGLQSNQISKDLGKQGLTGTFAELTNAVLQHVKGGDVLISTFNASQQAAADANIEIKAMPPNLAKMAQGYLNGSITAAQWTADMKTVPGNLHTMMSQFATTAGKTHQFNDALAKGGPAAQTYNAAMSKLMGGTVGLNTALMLTGSHTVAFNQNVGIVADAAAKGGTSVANWSVIQGTFNQKLDVLKSSAQVAGIALGTALLPMVQKIVGVVVDVVKPIAEWINSHQKLAAIVMGSIAGFLLLVTAINMITKVAKGVKGAFDAVSTSVKAVGKLFGFFSDEAAAAATSADAAAVSTDGLAVSADGAAVSEEGAAVATDAANTSLLGTVIAAGRAVIVWTAQKIAMVAGTVATWAATAATTALGVAIDFATGPIGLIIIGIVALVAVFVFLWEKFSWFRDYWIVQWDIIKDAAIAVWDAIKDFFTKIIPEILDWITGHWRLIISIIGGPLGLAVALVTKYWSDIKKWFMDGVNAVIAYLMWFVKLPGMFVSWMAGVATAVSNGIGTVVNWFKKLPGTILGLLSDAGTWLLDVGKNIIEGLWNGISNALGGLESKVKGMAGDVKNWAKDALSILSPSQVMADEVGKYIPLGIAVGITDNMNAVESATRQAGNAAATGLHQGLSVAGLTAAPAGSGAAGGGQIYIDLRGSQVMSNNDMDMLVNKIGRAIATRVLPAGGVRINLQ
jgi:phage-related protein